jgi:hypothetical protein
LVAGEGLAGIVVVILRFLAKASDDNKINLWQPLEQLGAQYKTFLDAHKDPLIHGKIPVLGEVGNMASLVLVLGVCVLLYVAGKKRAAN